MITFCSLLYYKGLSQHVRMILRETVNKHEKYYGALGSVASGSRKRRLYKKRIVNKWHVMLFLMKNPILLMYRKYNMISQIKKKIS